MRKILLSAYACEPNRGSEPGVGWKWAITLANSGNEVHVLTRTNNRQVIEEYWAQNKKPNSLHFHYYDCNRLFVWAKHHHLPVNIYYACWLYGSVGLAKKMNDRYHFDIAHHITFGVYRFLPRLYKLGIPVVLGPLGGGEYTPKNLLCLYSFKDRVKEYVRMFFNKTTFLNPFYHIALNNASVILTKTEDTRSELQKKSWRNKAITELELGIDSLPVLPSVKRKKNQFLFVGRFIYWKGVRLALETFNSFCKKCDSSAKLVFVGKGDMESYITSFAKSHKLENNIEIISWIDQKDLGNYYQNSCAMLFPSLHDSSGNVILESLSHGLPVICLKCGGPASVMDKLSETMIEPNGKTIDQVINEISDIMQRLVSEDSYSNDIQDRSLQRAAQLLWVEKAKMIDEIYHKAVKS